MCRTLITRYVCLEETNINNYKEEEQILTIIRRIIKEEGIEKQ